MKPLAVIPTYITSIADAEACETTLRTLRETAEDECEVMVVDDGSPEPDLVKLLGTYCEEWGAEMIHKPENEGFSTTVNVGLRRALEIGCDAVLVNADVEFGLVKDWLGALERQVGPDGETLASVVGALLLYPQGMIQHAGIGFSLLTRDFFELLKYGPGNLPEALVPRLAPVTGALQFIRHECLAAVGLYDETFKMGWEDVDYCIRVFESGRDCVYTPEARAVHHEHLFRGRRSEKIEQWTDQSWRRFAAKWADTSFIKYVPNALAV